MSGARSLPTGQPASVTFCSKTAVHLTGSICYVCLASFRFTNFNISPASDPSSLSGHPSSEELCAREVPVRTRVRKVWQSDRGGNLRGSVQGQGHRHRHSVRRNDKSGLLLLCCCCCFWIFFHSTYRTRSKRAPSVLFLGTSVERFVAGRNDTTPLAHSLLKTVRHGPLPPVSSRTIVSLIHSTRV